MSHLTTAMCPKCWCICCVIFLIFGLAVRMSHLTTAMCPKCWCICCVIFKFWPCCTDVPSDDSNVSKVLVYMYFVLILSSCTDSPAIYVTGSTKTVLIAQDRKFDFFTQTQSLMDALSSFTATVDQSKVVCFCWLLF